MAKVAKAELTKVRIDKWLWAARFYKTRSLARKAVEGGKVRYEGARIKPSKEIEVGRLVVARIGNDDKEVQVLRLSEKRGSAPIAQTLYEETEASITQREKNAALHQAANAAAPDLSHRPNKQERRKLKQLKNWPE